MKILVAHNRYRQRAGEEVVFDNMIRILTQRGHQIISVIASNASLGPSAGTGRTLLTSAFSPGSYFRIRALIRKERPDAAIVQNVFPILTPAVYWALRAERVPVLQKIFNYRLACPAGTFFSRGKVCERCIGGNYFHGVVRKCYRDSFVLSAVYSLSLAVNRWIGTFRRCIDRYVVPDRFFQAKLTEAGYETAKFRRAANPFDVAEFQPELSSDGSLLFVGRLVREKGVVTLLEAARRAPEANVVVVGDGPLRPWVEKARPSNVTFLGPQYGEDLKTTMARAAAVVVPSEWYDNGPMVVYQAFAMGKPVLASDIDGLPEIVLEGKTGWLVPPGDVDALAAALRRIPQDPASSRQLGRQARAWAEENLSADRYYRDLLSVLKEVCPTSS
jgi:glycosyltransferase involved in cell wall biosynthesis